MNEQQIRAIVRDEMSKNYDSGSPKVPRHTHDGVSNTQLSQTKLKEFISFPSVVGGVLTNSIAQGITTFQGSGSLPIPIVFGSGIKGFPGFTSTQGMILAFWAGSATGSYLYVYIDNDWHGIPFSF